MAGPAKVFASIAASVSWAFLFFGTSPWALAQEEDELDIELQLLGEDEVVSTAARHPQDIAESPSFVTVIPRERIENSSCIDLPCLLQGLPEVDVKQVMGSWPVVGARAYTTPFYGDTTIVLVDGRELSFELPGMPPWQFLPVHLEDIERIEVVRGPQSALYGSNAASLVVSITTREQDRNRTDVFLGVGEHDTSNLHFRTGWKNGAFEFVLFGSEETIGSFGVPDLRESEVQRLFLRVNHKRGSGVSTFQAGLGGIDTLCQTSFTPLRLKNGLLGDFLLGYRNDFLQTRLSFSLFSADGLLDMPLSYRGVTMGRVPEELSYLTDNLEAETQLNWSPFENNLLVGGANYRWSALVSDDNAPSVANRHLLGFFIQDEQRLWQELRLIGGLRLDFCSLTPSTISPRLAVIWRLSQKQHLRFGVGRAYRKQPFFNTLLHIRGTEEEPGFEGLAAFIERSIGNKNLRDESITAVEAGYAGRFQDGRLTLEADAFYNRYRENAFFYLSIAETRFGTPNLSESVMEYRSTGRDVDSVGGSLSLTFRFQESSWLEANYTYRYSFYVSKSDAGALSVWSEGNRVAWEPQHLANLALFFSFPSGLRMGLSLHATSNFGVALPREGNLTEPWVRVPNPTIFFGNAFAGWRLALGWGWMEAGVRVFDLLGTRFRSIPSVTRPDGEEIGGELLSRRVFIFLRGSLPWEENQHRGE